MKIRIVLAVSLAALAVGVWIVLSRSSVPSGGGEAVPAGRVPAVAAGSGQAGAAKAAKKKKTDSILQAAARGGTVVDASSSGQGELPLTEEDRSTREEERLVAAFDALTDRWIKPVRGGVTMKEVESFVAQFKKVPKARKEECLQRALNLVPDENVMLLAGILMDKSQDRELIELVYNDVLNRDEGVKKPILQQIFTDKEHPCWADTAWILDVTGELPKKK